MKHAFPLATILSLLFITGCGRNAEITSYQIPKESETQSATDTGDSGATADSTDNAGDTEGGAATSAPAGRMLAAMATNDNRVWFFKLLGPDEGVAKRSEAFESFLKSVDFSGGQPKWELPDGWQEKPGSGMRFATLNAGQPGLDVSVISLPSPQNVLENVNRWRGQLQVPAWSDEELKENSNQVAMTGDVKATLVNLAGTLQAGGGGPFMRGRAPFAGGAAPFAGGLPPNHPPVTPPARSSAAAAPTTTKAPGRETKEKVASSLPDPGFEYTKPDDWVPGRMSVMRKLAFNTSDDDDAAVFTATTLGKAGAAMLPNVNRWRGQVGLSPVDDAGLDKVTSAIEVSGEDATWIELVGEGDDAQAMFVVMAERGNLVWFYKLMGKANVVGKQKENFKTLIQSIKF